MQFFTKIRLKYDRDPTSQMEMFYFPRFPKIFVTFFFFTKDYESYVTLPANNLFMFDSILFINGIIHCIIFSGTVAFNAFLPQ